MADKSTTIRPTAQKPPRHPAFVAAKGDTPPPAHPLNPDTTVQAETPPPAAQEATSELSKGAGTRRVEVAQQVVDARSATPENTLAPDHYRDRGLL